MNTAANTPPLSDQVVDWLLLLRSGQATRTDYARFLAWRNANPMNENAWQQLTGTLAGANTGRLGDAYPTGYDGADQAPPAELPAETLAMPARRHFLSSVGALALGGAGLAAAAYVGNSFYPLNALAADAATNTGERRRYMLSDGSELLLDARSRVNLEFTATYRRLHLLEGAVSVTVRADPYRPFSVQTAEGVVRSLGTRYMVRQQARRTLVVVHENDVEIETVANARGIVRAGTGARFDATRVDTPRAGLAAHAAWENGWIEAHGRPLADVVAAMRPYRRGTLRVSMAAGGLPVSGTFPLDDSDATLVALQASVPIRVTRLTPWFVSIGVATA